MYKRIPEAVRPKLEVRIPEAVRPKLEVNDVGMATADGSHLSDLGKVNLRVKVDSKEYEHSFIVANVTNEGILGTDFLGMHGCKIDFCTNMFFSGGHSMSTRNALDRNKCYRVSLAEKVAILAGSRVIAPGKISAGILPSGDWMVEGLHKPPGGKCVMVGRSLVEEGTGKVAIEMFNPLEEDVLLNKNTHSALVHPVEVNEKEEGAPARGTQEAARKVSTMAALPEELLRMSEDVQFNLNTQEKKQWRQLLERHKNVFQLDGQPLGRTQLIQHEIHTSSPLICQPPRRFPIGLRKREKNRQRK